MSTNNPNVNRGSGSLNRGTCPSAKPAGKVGVMTTTLIAIPVNIQTWLSTLVYEPKRTYATKYATAKLAGKRVPADPKTAWAEKARTRVDEMLKDPNKGSRASKTARVTDVPADIKESANIAFAGAFAAAEDGKKLRAGKDAYAAVMAEYAADLAAEKAEA
jgi:hypothetical protein